MAAHWYDAHLPLRAPELGAAGRLWVRLANTDPNLAGAEVAAIESYERTVILNRAQRTHKERPVPVGALLLATGHPVLRKAWLCDARWNTSNPTPEEVRCGEELFLDALRRRDCEALERWWSVPWLAQKAQAAIDLGNLPTGWSEALTFRTKEGLSKETAVALMLVERGVGFKALIGILSGSGQTNAVEALLAREGGPACLIRTYKSNGKHPAVRAFLRGHTELALRLYDLTVTQTEPAPEYGWGERIREAWLADSKHGARTLDGSVHSTWQKPPPEDALLRETRPLWLAGVVAVLHRALDDTSENKKDDWREQFVALERCGMTGLWRPGDTMGPQECARLMIGPTLPGSLAHLTSFFENKALLNADGIRGKKMRFQEIMGLVRCGIDKADEAMLAVPATWETLCSLLARGLVEEGVVGDCLPFLKPAARAALVNQLCEMGLPQPVSDSGKLGPRPRL